MTEREFTGVDYFIFNAKLTHHIFLGLTVYAEQLLLSQKSIVYLQIIYISAPVTSICSVLVFNFLLYLAASAAQSVGSRFNLQNAISSGPTGNSQVSSYMNKWEAYNLFVSFMSIKVPINDLFSVPNLIFAVTEYLKFIQILVFLVRFSKLMGLVKISVPFLRKLFIFSSKTLDH